MGKLDTGKIKCLPVPAYGVLEKRDKFGDILAVKSNLALREHRSVIKRQATYAPY